MGLGTQKTPPDCKLHDSGKHDYLVNYWGLDDYKGDFVHIRHSGDIRRVKEWL